MLGHKEPGGIAGASSNGKCQLRHVFHNAPTDGPPDPPIPNSALETPAMTILRTTAITPDHLRCTCQYRPATWGNVGLTQIFSIIFLIQNEANPNP